MASRVGDDHLARYSDGVLTTTLAELGRLEEAEQRSLARVQEDEQALELGEACEHPALSRANSRVNLALVQAWLALLDPVQGLDRVTVLPTGRLRGVDLHAATLHGQPLLARVQVVYALDLGLDESVPEEGEDLLIADPTQDLPAARAEAEVVAAAWPGSHRLLGDAATQEAVLTALSGASRLHYAGHAEFVDAERLSSALPLARGGSLRLADVLALPSAPAQVVLSGCETGRSATGAPVEELGLAQAFVLAGSQEVVATTRPLDDVLGSTMARSLYAAQGSLVARLRAAQLEALAQSPESDWASYRVWVP